MYYFALILWNTNVIHLNLPTKTIAILISNRYVVTQA